MRIRHFMCVLACVLAHIVASSNAGADEVSAVVREPFMELHTGPGRGFPVFHVFERGETFEIVARRTDWFRVRGARDVVGWVSLADMRLASMPDGAALPIEAPGQRDYLARRWEISATLGDFGGGDAIGARLGYQFTPNISAELTATDVSGRFSDGWLVGARLVHQPFPDWRIAPYFSLGTGVLSVQPSATLADTTDRMDQVASVGGGVRMYLTRRFLIRAEYENHIVFTNRNENEAVNEWKAGFAFFF